MKQPRTALVTGGTRGIGLGIARALAGEGWQLAICGVRAEADVKRELDELRQTGATVHYTSSDLRLDVDRVRFIAVVRARVGGVHVLLNNATCDPGCRAHLPR